MTTSFVRETAKIYDFPVKGRANGAERTGNTRASGAGIPCGPVMDVGGWYHGEAIREAARSCEPRR